MHPRIPAASWWKLALAVLLQRPRSFAADARDAASKLLPYVVIHGTKYIPASSSCLVTCNHYTRPGLAAWWAPLCISTIVATQRSPQADAEIHWVTTAAWTFPESPWRHRLLTPLTRWAFERAAAVYDFITMPPMPPAPDEVEDRATSVRRTLRLARRISPNGGMIGLAPEGRDTPDVVGSVPNGAGDFIYWLCKAGLPVLPVAVYEDNGHLQVAFGPSFIPESPLQKSQRDRIVAHQVMSAITNLVQAQNAL